MPVPSVQSRLLHLLCIGACMALHSATAQETQRSGAVSLNLLGVVVPWNDLRAEYSVAERLSVHASALALPMLRDWEGYGGAIGLRQYIAIEDGPLPLAGLSAGPQLAVVRWHWNEERVLRANADHFSFVLAGTLAYKWIWDHVLLEPSLVAGVVPVTPSDGPLSVVYLQAALHVGYAW